MNILYIYNIIGYCSGGIIVRAILLIINGGINILTVDSGSIMWIAGGIIILLLCYQCCYRKRSELI